MKKILTFSIFSVAALVLVGAGCISSSGKTSSDPAGFFISVDEGESWRAISKLPTVDGVKDVSSASVYRLVSDPQDTNAMYWASRKNGIFFTYDAGKSWQQSPEPFSQGFVDSVVVHPKDKCTLYATNGNFLYKTNDCSRSWTEVYRESRPSVIISSITIHSFAPYQIFITESNGDLLTSSDAGQSWHVVDRFGAGLKYVVSDPLQEGVFYMAHTKSGLFRSIDSGQTWESLSKGLKQFSGALSYRFLHLHPYKLNNLYWISSYGILISEDGGNNWKSMDLITSPGSAKIYGFAINPKDDKKIYYAATVGSRSTLHKTEDGGQTWTTKRLPSNQTPVILKVHQENTNWLYAGFTIPPKSK